MLHFFLYGKKTFIPYFSAFNSFNEFFFSDRNDILTSARSSHNYVFFYGHLWGWVPEPHLGLSFRDHSGKSGSPFEHSALGKFGVVSVGASFGFWIQP